MIVSLSVEKHCEIIIIVFSLFYTDTTKDTKIEVLNEILHQIKEKTESYK